MVIAVVVTMLVLFNEIKRNGSAFKRYYLFSYCILRVRLPVRIDVRWNRVIPHGRVYLLRANAWCPGAITKPLLDQLVD